MRIGFWRAGREERRRWLAFVGAVLLIGLLVAALHLCGVRVCLFHRLTGYPCLTCGGTRALAALTVGDVCGAFRIQPLVTALAVGYAGWLAVNAACWITRRQCLSVELSSREKKMLAAILVILAVCNWVYLLRCGV